MLYFEKERKRCVFQQKDTNAITVSNMKLLEPNGLKLMGIFACKISKSGQLWKIDIVPHKSALLGFS